MNLLTITHLSDTDLQRATEQNGGEVDIADVLNPVEVYVGEHGDPVACVASVSAPMSLGAIRLLLNAAGVGMEGLHEWDATADEAQAALAGLRAAVADAERNGYGA